MTQASEWQAEVGRSWADLYRLTDRAFSGLTQQLLERIERLPGVAILDLGCGAGELSLALSRLRPAATIVGADISADLVAAAQARAGDRRGVRFVEADVACWRPTDFVPDLLVSRHGVMFFADPVAAFANLKAIAATDARLVFSCFRDRRLNPWASELGALLPSGLATPEVPGAPGPFAFADPDRVTDLLQRAGWNDIRCEPLDFAYVAGMAADPVADALAFFKRIGPGAAAVRALSGTPEEAAFVGRMEAWLAEHRSGDTIAFPAAAWCVTARRE